MGLCSHFYHDVVIDSGVISIAEEFFLLFSANEEELVAGHFFYFDFLLADICIRSI